MLPEEVIYVKKNKNHYLGIKMPINKQQLQHILPEARQVSGFFVPALNVAMARFKIDSPVRMAAFLAQVGHESGQLTRMVENLNHSADWLRAVWPNRFDSALAAG